MGDFVDSFLCMINPRWRITLQMRRAALVAAIAAGFSGIFGVPVTGAIFAVEVLRVGELTVGEMFTPALIGSFFSDWTCRLVSMHIYQFDSHSKYTCLSCQGLAEGEPAGTPQSWFEPSVEAGLELLAVLPAA